MTINALKMINLRPRNRKGGDCVVLALTFITKAEYAEVEDLIKRHHSRYMAPEGLKAHGVYIEKVFKDHFEIFGYHLHRMHIPNNHTIQSFINWNPKGTFLVCIPHHALVIQDGQQYDAADSRVNSPVESVWMLTK